MVEGDFTVSKAIESLRWGVIARAGYANRPAENIWY
jgi:hypothetical protein